MKIHHRRVPCGHNEGSLNVAHLIIDMFFSSGTSSRPSRSSVSRSRPETLPSPSDQARASPS